MPGLPLGAVEAPIDETSLLVIVAAAALAGLFVMMLAPRLTILVVVVELLIGIVIGPQVADLAQVDPTTDFLGNLGLGMLFFFAATRSTSSGSGTVLTLAGIGWGLAGARLLIGEFSQPGWSSPTSTPGRRWRRPRSEP